MLGSWRTSTAGWCWSRAGRGASAARSRRASPNEASVAIQYRSQEAAAAATLAALGQGSHLAVQGDLANGDRFRSVVERDHRRLPPNRRAQEVTRRRRLESLVIVMRPVDRHASPPRRS